MACPMPRQANKTPESHGSIFPMRWHSWSQIKIQPLARDSDHLHRFRHPLAPPGLTAVHCARLECISTPWKSAHQTPLDAGNGSHHLRSRIHPIPAPAAAASAKWERARPRPVHDGFQAMESLVPQGLTNDFDKSPAFPTLRATTPRGTAPMPLPTPFYRP